VTIEKRPGTFRSTPRAVCESSRRPANSVLCETDAGPVVVRPPKPREPGSTRWLWHLRQRTPADSKFLAAPRANTLAATARFRLNDGTGFNKLSTAARGRWATRVTGRPEVAGGQPPSVACLRGPLETANASSAHPAVRVRRKPRAEVTGLGSLWGRRCPDHGCPDVAQPLQCLQTTLAFACLRPPGKPGTTPGLSVSTGRQLQPMLFPQLWQR